MAQYKNSGLDGKALAEKKSKRLEEALSAYTPEQTKQTVSKLLEEFVEDDGKNYFGAGNRDTTLYFADDEYIREMEKEKNKDIHKEEKASVSDKFHKLTSILEHKHDNQKPEEDENKEEIQMEKPEIVSEKAEADVQEIKEEPKVEEAPKADKTPKAEEKITSDKKPEDKKADAPKDENISKSDDTQEKTPEPEPTIVITPVKDKGSEKEDTEDMRREFFDDEVEVEAVPRRRRRKSDAPAEEKKAPEIKSEDIDEEEDFDEDYEEDTKKKNKFGNFFKHKSSDPFDDDYDDEFDDDDYDDEFDDDDYDDYEEGSTFKKILNAIIIIALICSTAFFAASYYSTAKKLESANSQINELNNGTSGNSEEEINQLKAKVDELTAENTRLKSGGSTQSSEPTSAAASGSGSTTITGTAPSDGTQSNGTGSGSTYTVKAGDNGSKICNAVYGQYTEELWNKILSANGMTSNSVYHPGDTLQIP